MTTKELISGRTLVLQEGQRVIEQEEFVPPYGKEMPRCKIWGISSHRRARGIETSRVLMGIETRIEWALDRHWTSRALFE